MTLDDIDFGFANGEDGTLLLHLSADGARVQMVFPDLLTLQDLLNQLNTAAVLTAYGVQGGTA